MTNTLKKAFGLALFYALFLVPLALHCAVYVHSPEFLKDVFASEDGIVEWLTVFCFLAAGIVAAGLLRHRARMTKLAFLYMFGLALLFMVCAGEEISWGQRLFGIQTPHGLLPINEQQEMNIHNIGFLEIHPVDLLSALMFLFGMLGPVVLALVGRKTGFAWRRYVSPLYLVPCFAVSGLFGTIRRSVLPVLAAPWGYDKAFWKSMATAQISEMYWGLCFLLAMLAIRRAWRAGPPSL